MPARCPARDPLPAIPVARNALAPEALLPMEKRMNPASDPRPLPPGFQLHPQNPAYMWNPSTNEVLPVPGSPAAAPAAASWGAQPHGAQAYGAQPYGGGAQPPAGPHGHGAAPGGPGWGAAPPQQRWEQQPAGANPQAMMPVDRTSWLGMTFPDAIGNAFRKYATFSGRASRSEYWYFVLFIFMLSFVSAFLDTIVLGVSAEVTGPLAWLVTIGTFLPSLAVAVRRLHDVGRSGWWILIAFTIIGIIPLLIWYCTQGPSAHNRFGPPVAHAKG